MDESHTYPELLTAKEVAGLLRLPLSTVYYLSKNGHLPGIQIGHVWRYRRDAILRLAAGEVDFARGDAGGHSRKSTNTQTRGD